ncbi:MAG: hypothetical protein VKJ06_02265 [Vampirovibrionales bacterium]|nr:hypothetical protein [Vampirovibrionales bacterium]
MGDINYGTAPWRQSNQNIQAYIKRFASADGNPATLNVAEFKNAFGLNASTLPNETLNAVVTMLSGLDGQFEGTAQTPEMSLSDAYKTLAFLDTQTLKTNPAEAIKPQPDGLVEAATTEDYITQWAKALDEGPEAATFKLMQIDERAEDLLNPPPEQYLYPKNQIPPPPEVQGDLLGPYFGINQGGDAPDGQEHPLDIKPLSVPKLMPPAGNL